MKVIIAGSRSITDKSIVIQAIINSQFTISEIVSGGAEGVDRIGEEIAHELKVPIKCFIPDWERLANYAGLARNQDMAEYADALIAVWDGHSRGTKHMIWYAERIGLPTYKMDLTLL